MSTKDTQHVPRFAKNIIDFGAGKNPTRLRAGDVLSEDGGDGRGPPCPPFPCRALSQRARHPKHRTSVGEWRPKSKIISGQGACSQGGTSKCKQRNPPKRSVGPLGRRRPGASYDKRMTDSDGTPPKFFRLGGQRHHRRFPWGRPPPHPRGGGPHPPGCVRSNHKPPTKLPFRAVFLLYHFGIFSLGPDE